MSYCFALRVDGRYGTSTPVGYSYEPYGLQGFTKGQSTTAANTNPYTFHSGILDPESGLIKFGQRWYDDYFGIWTQQDTLDAPLDPANANRYAFAGDDPINRFDPTGRGILNDIAGGLLGIVVGVVCEALTVGLGSIGCAVVGIAVTLAYTYTLNNLETGGNPTL